LEDEFFQGIINANRESSMISNRIKDSIKRVEKVGGYTGRVKPFGYDIVKVNGIKMLVENDDEMMIFNEIKDMCTTKKVSQVLMDIKEKYENYKWTRDIINKIRDDHFSKLFKIVKNQDDLVMSIQNMNLEHHTG
jgi:DNA invertase Pin-like site-specific DNA recombinase